MHKYDFTKDHISVIDAYRREKQAGNYDNIFDKYKDPATKYAFQVLEENVLSSEMMKLDSFRHLQDLRRQTSCSNFKYHYDINKAREIVKFASLCPNPDSGKPVPLMLWQLTILCKIVGWRDEFDNPRFTDIVISIARTNGKTYLSSILIAYFFLLEIDGKNNQDLAYVGTTASQTDKGWRYIASTIRQIDALPGFKKLATDREIRVVSDKVADESENRLLKMSQQSGVFDAFHFKFAVVDEAGSNEMPVGKIKDNKSKITTGMTQTSGQVVQISTAYPDSRSYLYEDERTMREIMQRDCDRAMDSTLCMVWEQDNVKEADKPETWSKSNPLLNLSEQKREVMLSRLIQEMSKAKENGTLNQFENKSLNIWLEEKVNSYLALDDIEAAKVDEQPIDIDGRDVFIGLDLSHFSDDTAVVFTFPYVTEDGENCFYIQQHSFVPLSHSQGNLQIKMARDGVNYYLASQRGHATIASNKYGFINDDEVFDYIVDCVTDYNLNVKYLLYDAWEASPLITRLDQTTNWQLMPVRQGTLSLSQPTSFFRQQMMTRHVKYDKDDVIMPYSLKNAVLLTDNHGIKVDKDRATAKIDVVDAIIDTMFRAQYYFDDTNPDAKADKHNPFAGWSQEQQHDYFSNYTF